MRALCAPMIVGFALVGCSVAFPMEDYDRGGARPPSETGSVVDGGLDAAGDAGADDAAPSLPACASTRPVYRVRNPSSGDSIYTMTLGEATGDAAKAAGYTEDLGVAFRAYPVRESGPVVPVYRLFNKLTKLHLFTRDATERDDFVSRGYTDEGIGAYVVPPPGSCGIAIHRLNRSGVYAFARSEERAALVGAGWTDEGTHFFAGAP